VELLLKVPWRAVVWPYYHIDDGSMGGGGPIPHKWDKFPESEKDKLYSETGLWSYFTPTRHHIFHYCIFAHYGWKPWHNWHGGNAEHPGDTFLIFEEAWGNPSEVAKGFMHELGHNLDLNHCDNKAEGYEDDWFGGECDMKQGKRETHGYCTDCWEQIDLITGIRWG